MLNSVQHRSLTGAATEEVSNAKIKLATMRRSPEYAFRCGAVELHRICLLTKDGAEGRHLYAAHSESRGISLSQMMQLSETAKLRYQMAFRERGAMIPTPAVINWKIGHYATVIDKSGDLYRISDRLDRDIWVRSSVVDEEATGYFLIPAEALPAGWRRVDTTEGDKVWGRGAVGGNYPDGPGPSDPQAFAPSCGSGGSDGATGGMTTYNVAAATVSLELHDRLLTYKPSLGPAISFEIFYNQRDATQHDGQAVFSYANFGPKWTSIPRLIENSGEFPCVLWLRGFGLANDSRRLPWRRGSGKTDRVGARRVGGLSCDAAGQRDCAAR